MSRNLLQFETSPYLLQHQHQPVNWWPWSKEAFDEAQLQNKPILLSIGYAACHWCHIMAHESFDNMAVAYLMNENFINIKVDKEERPDIDRYYQQALRTLGGQGGWPLTLFLTPFGQPFWGGTYFPPEPRYSLPAFGWVLKQITHLYHQMPSHIQEIGEEIEQAIKQFPPLPAQKEVYQISFKQLNNQLLTQLDPHYGGLRGAPKFFHPSLFICLWNTYQQTHDSQLKQGFYLFLTQISCGGIYDHLGGGYSRYSTDEQWLVPHFEKMLYDNAQLIELLIIAVQETPAAALFRQRIEETVGWLENALLLPEGGFASSLDADTIEGEGAYYTWTEKEIDETLKGKAALFKTTYGVHSQGHWKGKNILHLTDPTIYWQDTQVLKKARTKLLTIRQRRPAPSQDNKVLADWNGLAIKALSRASMVLKQPKWLQLAIDCFAFIQANLSHSFLLSHSWCQGRASKIGFLEDYASMTRAAITLYEMTAQDTYLEQAIQWINLTENFLDKERGVYYQSSFSANNMIPALIDGEDNVVPSGNSLMAEALVRLYFITGKTQYQEQAEKIFCYFRTAMEENPLRYPALINACHLFHDPFLVKIYHAGTLQKEFIEALFCQYRPNIIICHNRGKAGSMPYIQVCNRFSCSEPYYEIGKLLEIN